MGFTIAVSLDRKSTRLNSSHTIISYAVFCLKKKKKGARQMELTPVACWSRGAGVIQPRTPTERTTRDSPPAVLSRVGLFLLFFFFLDEGHTQNFPLSPHPPPPHP